MSNTSNITKNKGLILTLTTLLTITFMISLSGQNISVRQSNMPQVVQLPAVQQTIPVQLPISSNGQTMYQTVHLPIQSFASSLPNIIQANQGQLMQIPQLTQMAQAPQMAQIVNSNGQIQTVQLSSPIGNGQQIQIVNSPNVNNQYQNATTPATSPNVIHVSVNFVIKIHFV